jgi:hypothetical protein
MAAFEVELLTTQYSTNLELKLQQKMSKLRGTVREGTHVGKMASPVQQVGHVAMQTPAGRFAALSRVDSDFTRRWVFPVDKDLTQQVDSFDELKTIVDPKSAYVENAAAALARSWDQAIIDAAVGSASIGVDAGGLSAETFNTTNFRVADTFGSTAASGLTVAKLKEAKRILRHYENDFESDQLTLVIGSQQEADLLEDIQVVSTEFNDRPVLMEGRITRFLGFNIVMSERLPTYTTNTRGVLAYVKSGLYLGIWKDMQNTITQRNDLSGHPWQVYTQASFGASRLQPGKIIQIACLDSTGASINP